MFVAFMAPIRRASRVSTRTPTIALARAGRALGLLLAASTAQAHDCWIAPERFAWPEDATIVLRQRWGHELHVETEAPLDRDVATRFELLTRARKIDLLSEPAGRTHPTLSPLLQRRLDMKGTVLVVLDHGFEHIELRSDAWTRHLEAEGFPHLAGVGVPGEIVRERYARNLKSLLRVGPPDSSQAHARIVGQKLEIVLGSDPTVLGPSETLGVRVLFDGEPLAGARIGCFVQNASGVHATHALANAEGSAQLDIEQRGFCLLRVMHLYPCTQSDDADWESYWASFTFQLGSEAR